jgi:hypothetical protein
MTDAGRHAACCRTRGEVVIIPVFTTRSNVTGLSKHSEPASVFASVFVQPHGIASDLDHPRALDTSQTLEFARISEVALPTSLLPDHQLTR